jgi:hypothetical protein
VAVSFPPQSSASNSYESAPQTAGVVIEILAADLHKYDAREIGYERVRVAPLDRVVLPGGGDPEALLGKDAYVWCYVSPAVKSIDGTPAPWPVPNAAFPVIQSYLDVILDGCWTVGGEDLARNFLLTTHGWSAARGAFLDDRRAPGYVRSSPAAAAKADRWDALLAQASLVSQSTDDNAGADDAGPLGSGVGEEEQLCTPWSLVNKSSAPAGTPSIIDRRIVLKPTP